MSLIIILSTGFFDLLLLWKEAVTGGGDPSEKQAE
jgi:hypothetical protein